jgi:15-cis-phytoene synthase
VNQPSVTDLQTAYSTCARMQRRHDPTFWWATRRLPVDVRPAVHALYGYVRGADEIVDARGRGELPDAAARRHALDDWERVLSDGIATGSSDHPVIAALVDAGARHDLPLDELHVYMDSMRVDCGPVRIADDAELDRYMNGSAATVGRLMAPLIGAPTRREDVASLGVAFQLTNFIRDVREDWSMDRVYLPGLSEDHLAAREADDEVREHVARHVARARALFADTLTVDAETSPAVRTGMRVARAVYLRVLDRVEAMGFDVVGRRTSLWPWQAATTGTRALLIARSLPAPAA